MRMRWAAAVVLVWCFGCRPSTLVVNAGDGEPAVEPTAVDADDTPTSVGPVDTGTPASPVFATDEGPRPPPPNAPDLPDRTQEPPPPPPPPPPPTRPFACPDLFDEDTLPTFEITIAETDWAALKAQFAAGNRDEVWHPIVFKYGNETTNAMVRLRGGQSRCFDKMQFAISFNRIDDNARFHGVRRIDLDHGSCHLMQERLALSFMRDMGVPTPCANHAKLIVNGAYYALFTNLEHVNKDFLQRNFEEDDGNLYKYGDELKTNEEDGDTSDIGSYWHASTLSRVDQLVDLDESIREWATEAVMPTRDNYWTFEWNYYLYHHPTRGFLFIPNDLDSAFPAADGDELLPILPDHLQHPADIVLADPKWMAKFEDTVNDAIDKYDVSVFDKRIDHWWHVVRDAAKTDPISPWDRSSVDWFKGRVHARVPYLKQWRQAHPRH